MFSPYFWKNKMRTMRICPLGTLKLVITSRVFDYFYNIAANAHFIVEMTQKIKKNSDV